MADQPEEVTRLVEAIKAFEAIEDDEACAAAVTQALTHWTEQQPRLRALRQERVRALKAQGKTWEQIGQALGGISAARAQQIAAGVSGAQRRKAEEAAKKGQTDG